MGISFFSRLVRALPLLTLAIPAVAAETPTPDTLVRKAVEKRLWENRQWTYLVHYKRGTFGGWESQADGRDFFNAPDGKSNPEAELIATLRSYFRAPTAEELAPPKALTEAEIEEKLKLVRAAADGLSREETEARVESARRELLPQAPPPQHPVCRFPARLRFLKRELGWKGEGLPQVECHRLADFRRRLDAKSAALVFSSFYLNNPSSTFGHSFIRINSGLWSQYGNYRNELLDTGINYAADAQMANPVLYAFFGISGLFHGTFTAVQYYYKVREYNDYESRDLWSYDLNLTDDELVMLVDHIWEQGSTDYDYYYFTENCSYHMLTLIDAAAPRFGLQDRIAFYVIPSDTIRVAHQTPGLVTRVSFRPSVLSQFRYRLGLLSPAEREAFDRAFDAKDPDAVAGLSPESQARALDTYSDQVELTQPEELLKDGSEAQKLKQRILVRRASLGVKSEALAVPAPDRSAPHLAHGMRRISLGLASEKGHGLAETFGYKFAMNELLDPGLGYPRNTEIDFAQVHFRYRNEQAKAHVRFRDRVELDEIGIFKITALTPWSRYYPSKAIHAELGWRKSIDRDCESLRCLPLTLDYAPGLSFDPTGNEGVSLFAMAQGRFEYTPGFVGPNVRAGIGPRIGAMVYFSDDLRLLVESELVLRAFAREDIQYSTDAGLRWGFARGWAIDVAGKRARDWSEAGARLHFYY
jgi:hypothetical protein